MASAKQTAKDPEDLDSGPVVEAVESKSKAPKSARLLANSTFASRAKGAKRIGSASNKAITADESASK